MNFTRRLFLTLAAACAGTISFRGMATNIVDEDVTKKRTPMPLSSAELMMHVTVRLEGRYKDGRTSTGTGFFFLFKVDEHSEIPVIVTNKHVIQNVDVGTFVLTKRDANGAPLVGQIERVVIENFGPQWIQHPDPNVDLAIYPLAALYKASESKGVKYFAPPIPEALLPTGDQLASLGGMDNITMIGYPDGIWDQKNNMPIARHGITATNPRFDYNGLPIFVIDCACFPGSSGSPVFIFDRNGYIDAKGDFMVGAQRIILLGILFAGPQHEAVGEIKTIEVPLSMVPIALSKIPNNLGFVVKAGKIADFKSILLAKMAQPLG